MRGPPLKWSVGSNPTLSAHDDSPVGTLPPGCRRSRRPGVARASPRCICVTTRPDFRHLRNTTPCPPPVPFGAEVGAGGGHEPASTTDARCRDAGRVIRGHAPSARARRCSLAVRSPPSQPSPRRPSPLPQRRARPARACERHLHRRPRRRLDIIARKLGVTTRRCWRPTAPPPPRSPPRSDRSAPLPGARRPPRHARRRRAPGPTSGREVGLVLDGTYTVVPRRRLAGDREEGRCHVEGAAGRQQRHHVHRAVHPDARVCLPAGRHRAGAAAATPATVTPYGPTPPPRTRRSSGRSGPTISRKRRCGSLAARATSRTTRRTPAATACSRST